MANFKKDVNCFSLNEGKQVLKTAGEYEACTAVCCEGPRLVGCDFLSARLVLTVVSEQTTFLDP